MKKIYSLILSVIFLVTILISSSWAVRPVSYDAVLSGASEWGAMDCRAFANKFLTEKLGRNTLPSTSNDSPYLRRFNSVPAGYTLIGSYINSEHGTEPDLATIRNIFDQAEPGDIVLLYWDTSYIDANGVYHDLKSPHTAIISDVTKGSSVEFLHSNYGTSRAPCNGSFSYTTLVNCLKYQKYEGKTGLGGVGGFSVYHFNSSTTPTPPAPTNGVAINATNFPDAKFRFIVSRDCDSNKDGILSTAEVLQVTYFDLTYASITDLKGIEYFTALQTLHCVCNSFTKLDVSKNSALVELRCGSNQLTTLDVSKNSALQYLDCSQNYQLTKLDVSKNSALRTLYCSFNYQLTTLDVSGCTALQTLWCNQNYQLTKLDVNKNSALTYLCCHENQLTTLDVSKNSALQSLWCYDNQLTTLDVSKNSALQYLWCYNNKLTKINVSGCPNLTDNNIHCDSGVKIIRTQEDEPDEPTEENAPKITAKSLQEGRVGVSYSETLEASGTTPITWSAKGLPSGLKINKSTGEIYGSPKKSGSFDVTFTAQNKVNKKTASDSVKLSLVINPPLFTPKITTTSLSSGNTDKQYSFTLKASGTTPIKWTSGTLPNGFTLNPETGELSGNTSEVWNSKITFFATNSLGTYSKDLKLTIKGVNPKINTKKIDNAFQNKPYNSNLEAIGTAPLTWSATGLPEGLNIDPSTGNISGTPEVSGKFNVKITLANPLKSVSKTLKLIVESYPEITTDSMKTGTINKSYNFTMKAKAVNTKKFVWFAFGLPEGLSIALDTGKISGKPTESGTFTVEILASLQEREMVSPKLFTLEIKDNKKSKSKTLENLEAISIGNERSIENLTQNELSKLEGYIIAAVLPEITVTESGQYDFEIELDEQIQSGAKLFYFAFSDKESDDDEISEFYNISGEEIQNVPDEKIITVSAWLNSGVIYRPVIAVKSDTLTF